MHRLPRPPALAARLWAWLPAGGLLPHETWIGRHRGIVLLLWLHAAGLALYALATSGLGHELGEAGLIGLAAAIASWGRMTRRARSVAACFGLVTASAIIVHFSGGYIEMHFHFFVVVALMGLYQDWVPFLLAVGYVVLHHGVVGVLDPGSVYNHAAAWQQPWTWAAIHGLFIAAQSVATVVTWRISERQENRLRAVLQEMDGRRRGAETVAEVGGLVSQSLDVAVVGEAVAGAIARLLDCQMAALYRVDAGSGDLIFVAGVGTATRWNVRVARGTGAAGAAIAGRRPVHTPDILADAGILLEPDVRANIEQSGYRSVMALPLLARGEPIGAIVVGAAAGRSYAADEMQLATSLSHHAAIALNNAGLYKELHDAYTRVTVAQEQLVQGQKMEAVGRLAGGIAHDFNNLLTVIGGHARLLSAKLPSGQGAHDVETIAEAADRAAALTRQLLAFSRKQMLQPRVLNLNVVIAGMGGMLQRLIGDDIDLSTQLDPRLDPVRADPSQIEQVIMNLVVNTRDALPRGGKVTIETRNAMLDGTYVRQHAEAQPGRHVVLVVTDTGNGMDVETQRHLFEPFFTTRGPGHGTGLGLATVYGIVKQSGGHITVYSELGLGTTFKVYLPSEVAHPDAESAEPESGPEPARAMQGETVLLVEDDARVRAFAREALADAGFAVIEALGPEDALRRASDRSQHVDLLLTDVVMPGTSGRQLAQALAERRPDVQVLYMSGYTDEAIVRHGVLDAEVAFIGKPFTPAALAQKVREVLDAVKA